MPITKEHQIHYFIKDESNEAFNSFSLESYMAIPQNNNTVNYKRIEQIRLFFSTDMNKYECGSFHVDFGRNDCFYSGCKSYKELLNYMLSDLKVYNFKIASKEDYLSLRDKVFKLFLDHQQADYSQLEVGCDFPL